MRLIIMKFGGTSLADAERMRQVGAIVRRFSSNRLVVVVSALAGVTDALLACAADAAAGRAAAVRRGLARLRSPLSYWNELALVCTAGVPLALWLARRRRVAGVVLLYVLVVTVLLTYSRFGVALSWQNLLYCLIGVTVGTLIGVLPGIGPLGTIAILMPITYGVPPVGALIMLAGIYYGAQYGGSTTAILVNIPGEASSVVTTLDGFQMAKQGRAGAALAVSAIASFLAGTLGVVALTLLAVPLANYALKFGPAEYFCLMLFALAAVSSLTGDLRQDGPVESLRMLVAEAVSTSRENKLYLPGCVVPAEVRITNSLEQCLAGARIIIGAMPSARYPNVKRSNSCSRNFFTVWFFNDRHIFLR
jgi:hypothetical protein